MARDSIVPLADAALAARSQLDAAARNAARDARGSAAFAQAALFEEALLGALRARFAELRTVAR